MIFPSEITFGKVILRNFTALSKIELLEILACRNHDSVRLQMYNKDLISTEQHFDFIERLEQYKRVCFYGAYISQNLLGVCSFELKYPSDCAIGGLYKNPFSKIKMPNKSLGEVILESLEFITFSIFNMQKLRLEVYAKNTRAIALYAKRGFKKMPNLTKEIMVYEKFSS
ncbi:MAG: UDP-4-amino-4,6-dideoxy-N-acetyl-beta-L-altrosamine N-acetyltransferase [Helicobacter sp.]|nr:UDP-4-amino-4,6-dideoxy-N-acetyl-beta-L-altrosamine N-acetyltransferase [Helicobacter sp.]